MDFSVLVPVYNAQRSLKTLVEEIKSHFSQTSYEYEIILVDDCSTDQSWELIKRLSETEDAIKGIHLSRNSGQQTALYKGLCICSGRFAITIDDDLQHDISDVTKMIDLASTGKDLVFGIYNEYGDKGIRPLGSKIVGYFFKNRYKVLGGSRVSSYRLISREIYSKLEENSNNFVYLSAELLEHARKVGNCTVKRRQRKYGKSGYTLIKCISITAKLYIYYGTGLAKALRKERRLETHIDAWSGKLSN